jgi:hypothetical protein
VHGFTIPDDLVCRQESSKALCFQDSIPESGYLNGGHQPGANRTDSLTKAANLLTQESHNG